MMRVYVRIKSPSTFAPGGWVVPVRIMTSSARDMASAADSQSGK